jgi:hypothetical protein
MRERARSIWASLAAMATVLAVAEAIPADAVSGAAERRSVLGVPFAKTAIVPTGHFDVKRWAPAVSTHTLLDERGRGAVPVSEARFIWGDGTLYMFFYAADLDLQVKTTMHDGPVWNDDAVVIEFPSAGARKFVIGISPTGIVADAICPRDADLGDARCNLRWESMARIGTDYDGTINTLGDFDEEWAIEMALPLASIGVPRPIAGAMIPFSLVRCEVTYDGKRACGSWGRAGEAGKLVLAGP